MPILDPLTLTAAMMLAKADVSELCKMPKPTQINVVPKTEDVKFDYSRPRAALQSEKIDTVNPFGYDVESHTTGFMKGSIGMNHNVELGHEFLPRYNAYCVWYKTINLNIEIDPTIVIAKEEAQDPCRLNAVRDHELKHVHVDRKIVNKYAQSMGRKIYDGVKARGFMVGPIRADQVNVTISRMQDTIGQLIELEYQKMQIERQENQQAVDTLEEYERVDAICRDNKTTAASRGRR